MSSIINCPGPFTRRSASTAIAALVVLCACASEKPEARSVPEAAEVAPRVPEPMVAEHRPSAESSEDVRANCMLPDTRADSPQFDFDSSSLHPGGTSILDEVADCVLTGSLKGHAVTLVGHADPRGSAAYNRGLGMRRAEATRELRPEQYRTHQAMSMLRKRLEGVP